MEVEGAEVEVVEVEIEEEEEEEEVKAHVEAFLEVSDLGQGSKSPMRKVSKSS